MNREVHHHYIHDVDLSSVINRLDAILKMLWESRTREVAMSVEMDALIVAVNENTRVDDSIIEFLNGLGPIIADAAGDKAKSLALAAEVTAKTTKVKDALLAHTPAEPPVEPPVEPPA